MSAFEIRQASLLRASADEVWARAVTMEGVNDELAPWVRMTVPAHARGRTIESVPIGTEAFVSTLLAGGVLPFDRHRLVLVELAPCRFLERSSSWLHRLWEHERTVEPRQDGCRVVDRVRVEPRLPVGVLERHVVARIFAHRHRRLRERFHGGEDESG
jgi:hypothetical protein